jgi:transcriptional regulator with XRE-family HTH domain
MAYNFGAEIKKVIKSRGMTVTEFARRIHKSRENAYDIFRRKSLDTELLSVISQVLDYDFITKSQDRKTRTEYASEPKAAYGSAEHEMLLLREELFILRKEIVDMKKKIAQLEQQKSRSRK